MKPCPFCAEEIQDAAVVCKHCGRDLNSPAMPISPAPAAIAPKRSKTLTWTLGGVLMAVVGLYVVTHASSSDAETTPNYSRSQPTVPPLVISIAKGEAREIKAGEYVHYSFDLPARGCSIVGRVEGVSGGGKDFEGFIMNDDNFRNWSTNHEAKGFQSGRVVVWSPTEMVRGPGKYHFVVSNAFSAFTAKAVTIQAEATCP